MELSNAIIFLPKKGSSKGNRKDDDLYFSISKNKTGYITIKFYIGVNLARKLKINENSRLVMGCDKDDNLIWYLGEHEVGYAVRKEKKEDAYSSYIKWPFEFISKKMVKIDRKNYEIDSTQRKFTIFLFDYIQKEELILLN